MHDLAMYELPDRYSIELLAESARATEADVLAFWARENAVPAEEAVHRVKEVTLVALEESEGLVGVSTAYLQRSVQLNADFWHQRGYVAPAHRSSTIGMHFAIGGIAYLEEQFVNGRDRRGIGVIQELENEGLKSYFNLGFEPPTDMIFIGENEWGDHVRVHPFAGALAPGPPDAYA